MSIAVTIADANDIFIGAVIVGLAGIAVLGIRYAGAWIVNQIRADRDHYVEDVAERIATRVVQEAGIMTRDQITELVTDTAVTISRTAVAEELDSRPMTNGRGIAELETIKRNQEQMRGDIDTNRASMLTQLGMITDVQSLIRDLLTEMRRRDRFNQDQGGNHHDR